jgi:hypothetical protein
MQEVTTSRAASKIITKIQIQTQQAMATANWTARSIELINNAIEHSPSYLQYLALQKWNGSLPQGHEGAVHFISIPSGYQNPSLTFFCVPAL